MQKKVSKKKTTVNNIALLPMLVFLVLYLGTGITFEYVMKIPMGFYNIPIVGVFLVALAVACIQNKKLPFSKKLDVMSTGIGDKNIITMILIFLLAGAFVGVVGRSSASSVAYFVLSHMPTKFAVAVLFIVSCFISISMGTSVGTITLVTPIAYEVATASNFDLALCVASVIGGAMFGDNLSFISDTTIAACNGQGCKMKDKFRANFRIAFISALFALAIIAFVSFRQDFNTNVEKNYNLIQIIPYVLVLIGGIVGVNVFLVLIIGIISGSIIMLMTGSINIVNLVSQAGSGMAGMYETTMVAILVAAMGALIKAYGGFDAIVYHIKSRVNNRKGGLFGIALLVTIMDVATANNTVAIVMANPIAKELSKEFDISSSKTASILDIFSCIMQGIIPYGAQILVAISAVAAFGANISAFEIIPKIYYVYCLLGVTLISMLTSTNKINKK
ncbi:MAG: Na+/H+ antiporter NhaC family protein [Lachnospiraceae bacterium]|nr:Na+/H+ antiporter NhaC family protein [Lachnospiraceae bacterium]